MRITGGELCGRILAAPKGMATRPTQDRVRESLFAILGGRVQEASILDMFAGSGSLGIEAISRGAAHCTFVEKSRIASEALQKNIGSLGIADKCKVILTDAVKNPAAWSIFAPFDMAFIDPPYASGLYERAIELVRIPKMISHMGIVVIERDKGICLPDEGDGLKLRRTERYGATLLDFYQFEGEG